MQTSPVARHAVFRALCHWKGTTLYSSRKCLNTSISAVRCRCSRIKHEHCRLVHVVAGLSWGGYTSWSLRRLRDPRLTGEERQHCILRRLYSRGVTCHSSPRGIRPWISLSFYINDTERTAGFVLKSCSMIPGQVFFACF